MLKMKSREQMIEALQKTLKEGERLVVISRHKGKWGGGWIITITPLGDNWIHKWGIGRATLLDEYRHRVLRKKKKKI